ncbi:TPA: lysine biosynthesis protein LysX [Candidatus Woesearchaeota archaeon]|nr:Lysine biosynthesis protein LysX [archaeon GW2011_AR15]MBS3103375.1 lysine biosynthesis protein LysX [Candidatus Woesearchaeota archaeon]HIH41976.1 lysine biosynthesis protein LysX [Candidatus Woesearchaeota archaeon]
MKVGFLYSIIRPEEKLLLQELRKRNVEVVKIDDGSEFFDISKNNFKIDVLLERSVSYSRGLYISKIFEGYGIPVVNRSAVSENCGDKFVTSRILTENKIPTPKVIMAFTPETALEAVEKMGYPCVIKPVVGSWARLVSKITDRHSAEAVIEHKKVLGGVQHSVFYIQEYVEKPGRDIRAFVVDGKTICAIYRSSEHWITNTARGGKASNCPVTKELDEICRKAAKAVGGGILAIDLFETKKGLVVNEVNHTMEFRNSITATGVNIPEKMIDYVLKVAKNGKD